MGVLTRFRDWWWAPVVDSHATMHREAERLRDTVTNAIAILDNIQYHLSARHTDGSWRRYLDTKRCAATSEADIRCVKQTGHLPPHCGFDPLAKRGAEVRWES